MACTREGVEEIFSSADKNKSGQLNIRYLISNSIFGLVMIPAISTLGSNTNK